MKNKILIILVFLSIAMFIFGCKAEEKVPVSEEKEEIIDTGAIVVESSPGLAQVYIGEEYRGDTPLNLYNLPIGQYEITVKKEGFADFKKIINIKVGRTEEIDVTLTPLAVKPEVEEKKVEELTEKMSEIPAKLNKINLSSFAMYYDFDKMEFTELRKEGSDLFSRKYDTYVHFTVLIPTKINVINKPINEVQKEDCIFGDTSVTPLFSGQTLCVKTMEGSVVAIGGTWQTMPTELEFVIFN